LGKFGAFIGCSNYPECRYTRPLAVAGNGENGGADDGLGAGAKELGVDPVTSLPVTLRKGPYGPYVQLGEAVKGEKPKRAGLPKNVSPEDVDLDRALALLSLPREVGLHPEDGEPIRAGIGRFGPYVQHGKTYASLDSAEEVFTVGLNRAVALIAEKRAKGTTGRRFGADPGRSLGDHPTKGGPVVAKKGRYGPYVSHAGVNATLPADKTPDTITLEEAVALIDARAERTASAPRARPRQAKRPGTPAAATPRSSKRATKATASASPKRPASNKSARNKTQAAE